MQTIISQQNFINWSTVLYTLLVMVSLAAAGSCVAFVDMLGCFTAGSYCSERFFLLREILHLCEATFLGEENHAPKCSGVFGLCYHLGKAGYRSCGVPIHHLQ